MLFAQSAPFFPPWYFWVFVLAVVITVCSTVVAIVFLAKRAENERRFKERELSAHLIEIMLTQRKMSPAEIDQVLGTFSRRGTFWNRIRQWLLPVKTDSVATELPGEKGWQYKV